MNKKGFQMSFQWLFAIIVGIVILFLTIYGITRLIDTGERAVDYRISEQLGILLNPLETGISETKSSYIDLASETRIYNICDDYGIFGSQGISTSQKGIGNKWSDPNPEVEFYNKYIFSDYIVQGRRMYLFSKPFNFPYKIGNLIYMTPESDIYCFMDAPEDIQDELENLDMKNVLVEGCLDHHIKVCFEDSGCDIDVDYDRGVIEKQGDRIVFEGDALMYAGIFSEPLIYECQVKRLIKRVSVLAGLYKEKADLISISAGCGTNLNEDLQWLNDLEIQSSDSLFSVSVRIQEIDTKNKDNVWCRLW